MIEKRVVVSGEDLTDAQPGFDQRTGEPIVSSASTPTARAASPQVTQENVGKPFAIVLDNEVISAPVIREPILGGSGQISGSFTVQARERPRHPAARRRAAGAADHHRGAHRRPRPRPGFDREGQAVVLCRRGLVVIFMFVTYGLFGLFANIAVAVNVAMIFGVLSLLNATLTLPGIAGIVLTVGIAVDSNVLIYERIREEVRAGRTADHGDRRGFTRALATILDSNITTFIAAAVLFYIGTGPVRGFAVTLGIGIITTVFTAFTLTRLIVAMVGALVRGRNDRADLVTDRTCGLHRHHAPASHRPGRHQVRFHALPAHQLSGVGAAVDPGDRAVLLPRPEFRHRLRRRHADGGADEDRAGRSRQDARDAQRRSVSATCSCSSSARRPTC